MLESLRLLTDACLSFDEHCADGLVPDEARIARHLHGSLMLVTALNPHIGYDRAADIAKTAYKDGSTLREAAIKLGHLTGEEFDRLVDPLKMVGPRRDG